MEILQSLLLTLGEIKGELVEIRKLSERVARLERWQYWLKGAWAVAAYVFLWKVTFGR